MKSFVPALLCLMVVPAAPVLHNAGARVRQSVASSSKNAREYPREPLVVEQFHTKARFERDGTGERLQSARIRVQDELGVQQLKELIFPYISTNESISIHFARVRKPDGTVIAAGSNAARDVLPNSVRDAPAFSNFREKRITAPGLAPGDILEYEVAMRIFSPFALNEFWYEQNFIDDAIVLDEQLEIDVPQDCAVHLVSHDLKYERTQHNDRVIYLWKRQNLAHPKESAQGKDEADQEGKIPSVELTTFSSWGELSRWYTDLQKKASQPNSEIRAKTQQLIAGIPDRMDKIRALYKYVSTNIRYVNLPLGAVGYQSHPAAEVFKSRYGDGKDKESLLVAMLASAGIACDTAFISSSRKFDRALPSPAQFDNVIAVIPGATDTIWLDPSTGVAPFRFLGVSLRSRQALLISPDGPYGIVKSSDDPPFLSTQTVKIQARVNELGKLTAKVHYALRGDNEYALRLAFEQTPHSEWKQLGQTLLSLDGLPGEVTSVVPGDPTDTRTPFELELEYSELNFINWFSGKSRVPLPLLSIGLPQVNADNAHTIRLGSPLSVSVDLRLALPDSISVQTPVGTVISRSYCDFRSIYAFGNHTLRADRTLNFKSRDLAASQTPEYLAFATAVESDQSQPLIIENAAPGAALLSSNLTAGDLLETGSAALNAGNLKSAIPLLERTIKLDPENKQAWGDLGLAYLRAGKPLDAARCLRKHIQVNPNDEHARDYLGTALQQEKNYGEAASAFREQISMKPLDPVARASLGEILLQQKKYSEAIPELDKATVLAPDNAALDISLGQAFLGERETGKALSAFDKAARISKSPRVENAIAITLAENHLELETAFHYAQSAVNSTEEEFRGIDASRIKQQNWTDAASVGVYWDTLGWVYFQKGDADHAEKYLLAAWRLDESSAAADHLAQIYEKRGDRQAVQHALALAAAVAAMPEARSRLADCLGLPPEDPKIEEAIAGARSDMIRSRTFTLGRLLNESATADFAIIFSLGAGGTQVDSLRFESGNARLRVFEKTLYSLDYGPMFPGNAGTKLLRRGRLTCSAGENGCKFTLIPGLEAGNPNDKP